jgi:ribosomal protein S18 acetylase RimI-like enzyme
MAGLKLLLDTNIVIALEDFKPLSADLAALSQKAQLHGLTLFIDEAAIRDVNRDPDLERRTRTLSKLSRFPLLEEVAHSNEDSILTRFGHSKHDNDRCDALMLDSLYLGIVDFLISEDVGLHKRAARSGLADRVFHIAGALSWIRRTFEPQEFRLPYVIARKAHQISLADPFFETLRDDYPEFDHWFEGKCRREHRDCWVVEIDHRLAGLAIRKDESEADAQSSNPGRRILKICTFKISPDFRGEKLGEHLLKKILWFAQANAYDLAYLTAYPKQAFLIALLQQFGFQSTREMANGELVLERQFSYGPVIDLLGTESPLAKDLEIYPRYYSGPRVSKFVVPIRPPFHTALFPEIAEAVPLPMFPNERFVVEADAGVDRTPGNTIRKVYVCRAPIRQLQPGDLLLFYLSKSDDLVRSQAVTSIGIVEATQLATSINDLLRSVGRRSVYSHRDLNSMNPSAGSPVLVIDFLLIGHLQPSIHLEKLIDISVFASRPPQSIARINDGAFGRLSALMAVGYN